MNVPLFAFVASLFVIAWFVIGSYAFLFYCKKTIDEYNVFFHDHNHKTQTVIDAYGDCRISNAYVITTPINNFKLGLLNLITMKNCKHIVDELRHVSLMIEITVDKNKNSKKLILIEKTNCINVSTDFHMEATCMVYKIKIKNKGENKITLRHILDETCNRIGKSKFFNWHIYKNNCQHFIKQMVSVINSDFKHLQFKSKKKAKQYCNSMFCSKHMLHIYYSLLFLYNFFQKYIINVQQHVISILFALGAWGVS